MQNIVAISVSHDNGTHHHQHYHCIPHHQCRMARTCVASEWETRPPIRAYGNNLRRKEYAFNAAYAFMCVCVCVYVVYIFARACTGGEVGVWLANHHSRRRDQTHQRSTVHQRRESDGSLHATYHTHHTAYHIASHRIASHHITSHHITSHTTHYTTHHITHYTTAYTHRISGRGGRQPQMHRGHAAVHIL